MAANGAQLPPPPPPPPPVDWEEALYDALRPAPKRIANTPNVTDTPEPFSALLSDERRVRASQDGAARVDLVKILGSLAVMDVCPGTEEFGDCAYPRTPRPEERPAGLWWTCERGRFCVAPGYSEPCSPGFYCPGNTSQPIFCPPRYYCAETAETIRRCPRGFYCPVGTVEPLRCIFADCPPGSDRATRAYVLVVFLLFAILVLYYFHHRATLDHARATKHRQEMFAYLAAKRRLSGTTLATQRNGSERTDDIDDASSAPDNDEFEPSPRPPPLTIKFENLERVLPNGERVLSGVSGELKAGRLCAVLGPSGSGKTTFLSVLMGKEKGAGGTVRVNGHRHSLSSFRKLIGHVPQEDIMIRNLTVRDILMHSARMRLPRWWKYQRIKRSVNETIAFLGLDNIMDSVVGTEEDRGISGGQRKRVNIGMELVAEPSVLFLDEPTSGLDSSMAHEICQTLRRIAHVRNILVTAIIHSPSPSTFRLFDDILLLGKGGRVVYFGATEKLHSYLSEVGFLCPAEESITDFAIDVVMGKVPSSMDSAFQPTDLFAYFESHCQGKVPILRTRNRLPVSPTNGDTSEQCALSGNSTVSMGSEGGEAESSASSQQRSYIARTCSSVAWGCVETGLDAYRWAMDVGAELGKTSNDIVDFFTCRSDDVRDTPRIWMCFWLLLKRAALQIYRSKATFLFDQLLHLGCGTFISIAIQNFDYIDRQPQQICNISPVMLQQRCAGPLDLIREAGIFVSLGVLFAGINAGTTTFGKERVVYWRDTSSGMATTPYFFAKVLADVPRILMASLSFTLALILLMSYRGPLVILYTVILLLYIVAFAMGYFLSTFLGQEKVGLAGTGVALAFALVFSGVMPSLEYVETYLPGIAWMWIVSAPRWAIEFFWLNEVGARSFTGAKPPNPTPFYYDWQRSSIFWIALGWHALTFLGLKLFVRSKQK